MESVEAYLARKREEIAVLSAGLDPTPELGPTVEIEEVIAAKFRLAALLKARHLQVNWAATETHWHEAELECAPHKLAYRYQRFDGLFAGPPIYEAVTRRAERVTTWTSYASCGMAAMAAVILGLSRTVEAANVHMAEGAYYETAHLIRHYFPGLRLLAEGSAITPASPLPNTANVAIFDSFAPAGFDAATARRLGPLDFAIVDTTCLAAGSGRIGRILAWAIEEGVPLALVRSHIKLDMLGIEYGRLGSLVFVCPRDARRTESVALFRRIVLGTRDAVRLAGATALPIALPPFLAHPRHRTVARRRQARILANARHLLRGLEAAGLGGDAVEYFAHGLFCTLAPPGVADRAAVEGLVAALVVRLRAMGIPTREAGSFGFDFIAIDAFSDVWRERNAIRIAMADLPTVSIDALVSGLTDWAAEIGLTVSRRRCRGRSSS